MSENTTNSDCINKCDDYPNCKPCGNLVFKGTPGDWYYQRRSDAYTNIVRSDQGVEKGSIWIVATSQSTDIQHKADAYIIAAAPDLLNALQIYLNAGSKDQRKSASIIAKKAIKKALTIKDDIQAF
jgi:hypothetical protein